MTDSLEKGLNFAQIEQDHSSLALQTQHMGKIVDVVSVPWAINQCLQQY
jgi:hypothetical protein